jgi:hypothetical protein
MKTSLTLVAILALALGACGDNIDVNRADARDTTDADPNAPDAPEGTPDADETPDAATSTVTVTAGDCAAADHEISTMSMSFRLDGGGPANPALEFQVGDEIQITVGPSHNFASTPTTGEFAFRSGDFGESACIVFTAPIALTDAVTYHCEAHATMTGTLVVTE